MQEKNLKSIKTDASLYNGQPTDTGVKCHCVGVTSGTPSIPKDRGGVSVENGLMQSYKRGKSRVTFTRTMPCNEEEDQSSTKQWFVLRVSYGRLLKAKEIIKAYNIECYTPIRYKQITKHGKKYIIKEPLIPSFIFVHSSLEEVNDMLLDKNVNSSVSRPLLSFYFDHTSYRQDNPNRNPPLIIRDESMNNFIRLTTIKNPHIIPVTSENIQYKLGDHVIVTEGDFEGIQGRVARIAGQQRVIVELFCGCLVATAYIPKEAMRKIIN